MSESLKDKWQKEEKELDELTQLLEDLEILFQGIDETLSDIDDTLFKIEWRVEDLYSSIYTSEEEEEE